MQPSFSPGHIDHQRWMQFSLYHVVNRLTSIDWLKYRSYGCPCSKLGSESRKGLLRKPHNMIVEGALQSKSVPSTRRSWKSLSHLINDFLCYVLTPLLSIVKYGRNSLAISVRNHCCELVTYLSSLASKAVKIREKEFEVSLALLFYMTHWVALLWPNNHIMIEGRRRDGGSVFESSNPIEHGSNGCPIDVAR
ncbi:hypothetical protein VNO77_42020 [Canavalia gladiata]|uniref:Uncharacterized protein n=1 Tax=Canavalia gladiata TaxID=3824 RepID=A0AAN9JZX3_CANGL